ncbi:MAG TPA: DsrE/DsrF/DrsH-like family protein [Candidatus Limnocylindrales bacterium]|nr:DsrE/DsrF/DrsH-like family protein [Candidatus Limnocylindrales bacterium]
MPSSAPAHDPIAEAIADVAGIDPTPPASTLGTDGPAVPEAFAQAFATPAREAAAQPRGLVIICYSGDLEKTWASLILASTAAASGVPTKVFLTFWGLQTFVRDSRRITGTGWMQRMLSVMERPGISHRKLSKLNFLGMGPWMMGTLARQHGVASPKELLEACMALGVEFMPCQMTMDMFGLTRKDMVEGLGEPVGAATVIELLAAGAAPLFI